MATPYSVPIEMFLTFCEEDRDFFQYLNLTDQQAAALANERATNYLKEACATIMTEAPGKSDFFNRDDVTSKFNFELTPREIYLLASMMFEMYLFRDIAKLKCLSRDYTATDLRVFDPSNARKTFLAMYNKVCERNYGLLETYRCTADDGTWRLVDFAGLDID